MKFKWAAGLSVERLMQLQKLKAQLQQKALEVEEQFFDLRQDGREERFALLHDLRRIRRVRNEVRRRVFLLQEAAA